MNHQNNHQQRRLKRKEWEPLYPAKSIPPVSTTLSSPLPLSSSPKPSAGESTIMSNQLLAGYMAHEFLTKGTLLGQKFDPARAEAVPVQFWKRNKYGLNNNNSSTSTSFKSQAEPSGKEKPTQKNSSQSYAEVSAIVKSEGTHIPGIVNPTQLARWIQM